MNKRYKVQEVMIDKNSFPVINDNEILKTALDKMNYFGYGIVCMINTENKLAGIITDGDLRRLINKDINLVSTPIKKVMTKRFKSVDENDLVLDVSRVMEEKKIYSLIVKNSKKRITGLIRMHEILSAKII